MSDDIFVPIQDIDFLNVVVWESTVTISHKPKVDQTLFAALCENTWLMTQDDTPDGALNILFDLVNAHIHQENGKIRTNTMHKTDKHYKDLIAACKQDHGRVPLCISVSGVNLRIYHR